MEPPTNVSGCWARWRDECSWRFNRAAHERERMLSRRSNDVTMMFAASMEPPTNVSGCTHDSSGSRVASMEPPTNVSGCLVVPRTGRAQSGFNGAAHERERMLAGRTRWPRLRHASMEPPTNVSGCSDSARAGARSRDASMEPPTNVSGCALLTVVTVSARSLQWSRPRT